MTIAVADKLAADHQDLRQSLGPLLHDVSNLVSQPLGISITEGDILVLVAP